MNKISKKNLTISNRLFYIFNSVFWIIVMFIVVYPLYLVCIASISDPHAIARGEVLWKPVDISYVGYQTIFGYSELWTSYANSLFYTAANICISVAATLMAAYVLSNNRFPGKGLLSIFFVVPMFFSGGLIPTFLTMRDMGLYDTRLILILNGCVTVWNLMVARTFIQSTIPKDLQEAAMLDGATHFQYFFGVIVPLSKTIMAVLAVYSGVAKWNDYYNGVVYIRDRAKLPLQTLLKEILASTQIDLDGDFMLEALESGEALVEAIRVANVMKYCLIVVSTAPIVILYFLLQKYFEKGVMIGSLKG